MIVTAGLSKREKDKERVRIYRRFGLVGKKLEGERQDISEITLPGNQLNLLKDAESASAKGNSHAVVPVLIFAVLYSSYCSYTV